MFNDSMYLTNKIKYVNSMTYTLKGLKKSDDPESLKKYRTTEELICHLKTVEWNPLSFTDEEYENATRFFTYTNYYNFSIYRKQLPRIEDRKHTFSDCLKLYDFDTFLRENINKFTGVVELMIRATLTSELCKFYKGELNNAEFYLDTSIYQNKSFGRKVLYTIFKRVNDSQSESIVHHFEKRNRNIPFWVIVEELTFGELCTFFEALTKEYRQAWLFEAFSKQESKHLITWFNSCRYMRNTCAHYSRVYGRYFTYAAPRYLIEDSRKSGIKKNQNETLFARLLAIKNILAYSTKSNLVRWDGFICDLSFELSTMENIVRLEKMGFPENWKEMLKFNNNV